MAGFDSVPAGAHHTGPAVAAGSGVKGHAGSTDPLWAANKTDKSLVVETEPLCCSSVLPHEQLYTCSMLHFCGPANFQKFLAVQMNACPYP